MRPVRIGICGLGTVGSGVVSLFSRNAESIVRRLDATIDIELIGARRDSNHCDTSMYKVTRDIFDVARSSDIDILVELIGGTDVAKDLVTEALKSGKHVVTANKALIAEHGKALIAEAKKNGVMLNFEAAVAGGIPVVQILKESLASNKIRQVTGIINGTSNYILSSMSSQGISFKKALADAQQKGYAEADPTFDIEGFDAAHKICILASIAFGIPLDFDKVYREGISTITLEDIRYTKSLGYSVKHLGIAREVRNDSEISYEVRVHPALVPHSSLLAQIDGVLNAIEIDADPVGNILLTGQGAGSGATASAVVADIINVARYGVLDKTFRTPELGFQTHMLENKEILDADVIHSAYYLRLNVLDKPGVMASIAAIFAEEAISIESIVQKPIADNASNGLASIVLVSHEVSGYKIARAQTKLEFLDSVKGTIEKIRIIDSLQ